MSPSSQPGAEGLAPSAAARFGDMQLRLVSYSAGYQADHWCHKGHVIFVLAGATSIERQDGRRFELSAEMTYQVTDDDAAPHRPTSLGGATVFIVD